MAEEPPLEVVDTPEASDASDEDDHELISHRDQADHDFSAIELLEEQELSVVDDLTADSPNSAEEEQSEDEEFIPSDPKE